MRSLSLIPLALLSNVVPSLAQDAGSIVEVGDTLVSAMMMLLGNDEKVYIMDKVEGNAATVNGHAAWAAEWDIATNKATVMDMSTNVFCASGMHFPNGSFATFGGNGAIGPGGNVGSVAQYGAGIYDATYQDYDGRKAIRILDPCTTGNCKWFDNATQVSMQKERWYSTAEPLADGSIILIGGFVNGGYINRNTPNIDPATEGGAAEPSYEYYPSRYSPPKVMQFMIDTSGLNSYAHAFLMPSGKIFAQANFSTILWDHDQNIETKLPEMPGRVIRVYPASGAVAMKPLTPENNWTPDILFCGGSDMPEDAWGNYSYPNINTWNYPASPDCHSIIPEPTDGSSPTYVKDDDLPDGRTMGQFIILPDGTMLIINGAVNGTAGYAQATGETALYADMPWGMSLASGPLFKPVIYDPSKPSGKRWSDAGLGQSTIPRLYHSSALLLPDASVLVAGSNPNVDVNLTTVFPTTYKAERFYPPYFANISARPVPHNLPTKLGYGGDYFDIELGPESYVGDANEAAKATKVVLIRPGFTTHAMNMGQRYVQLNNTFTVSDTGNITLHVSQVPPNANLLQPGPVMIFVVVHGLPSVGKMIQVGSGNIETQPTAAVAALPAIVTNTKAPTSTGTGSSSGSGKSSSSSNMILIIACAAGGAVLIGLLAFLCMCMRRRKDSGEKNKGDFAPGLGGLGRGMSMSGRRAQGEKPYQDARMSNASSAFIPLQQYNNSAFDVHENDLDRAQPTGQMYLSRGEDRFSNGSNGSGPYGAGAGYAAGSQVPLQAYTDDAQGTHGQGQFGHDQYSGNGYQPGGGANYDHYGGSAQAQYDPYDPNARRTTMGTGPRGRGATCARIPDWKRNVWVFGSLFSAWSAGWKPASTAGTVES
ncbi:Copper radical oxidase [Ceratobasidium theobromae]|uniref:Copper radical oxidase n=1 Tax=Ceratobasidium theobromae TaxID=1582974 RepID=A0A5N5QH86_9AGAM|nr:Copper radical oxidase [Ceratobasidium theobromae]